MYNTFLYTEIKDITEMQTLIDFQKTFGCVSWEFIYNVLNFLDIRMDFKKWVQVFYT